MRLRVARGSKVPLAMIELPWDPRDVRIAAGSFALGGALATALSHLATVRLVAGRAVAEVSGFAARAGLFEDFHPRDWLPDPVEHLFDRIISPDDDSVRHTSAHPPHTPTYPVDLAPLPAPALPPTAPSPSPPRTPPPILSPAAVAGTLARTMAQSLIHPIDTIKTRLQVKTPVEKLMRWRNKIQTKIVSVSFGGRPVGKVQNVLYRGPRDIYLGLGGSVVSTLGVGWLYFSTYQAVKGTLDEVLPESWASLGHMTAASAGALVSAIVRVPGDTLKHRVQAYFYPDCWTAARDLVRREGLGGLYKGFGATLIRDVPEIAIQFTVYESMRRHLAQKRGQATLPTYEHLLLGAIAGSVASSCTMPLDYIKTVVQCGRAEPLWEVVVKTVQAEGPKGLFKGMAQRVAMTTIMSAAFFGLFEFWKNVLKSADERKGVDRKVLRKMITKPRVKVWKRQLSL